MQQATQEVKSKSLVVGTAEYPQYDSVAEVVEGETEETICRMVNAQLRTDAMNRIRSAATSTPSNTRLRQKAFAMISMEEFQEVAGDEAALNNLLDEKVEEQKAEIAAAAPVVADEDEE